MRGPPWTTENAPDDGELSPLKGKTIVSSTVVPDCRGILFKSWTHQSYVQLFHHFARVSALGQPLKKEGVKSLTL